MDSRKKLISNLEAEVKLNEKTIASNTETIEVLKKRHNTLKDQYSTLLRSSYLKKMTNSKWSYLLSSENLNNLMLRWRYMHQFDHFTKQKVEEIQTITGEIQTKNEEINIDDEYTDTSLFRSNYYIDLSKNYEDLINSHCKDSKYRLKKALSKSPNFMIDQTDITSFVVNYEKKQIVKNFSENYRYDKDSWDLLLKTKHVKYLEIREKNRFQAGGFFAENFEKVDYI